MEQNVADFLKVAFSETDIEQLHFDDDTATEASADVPQNEPDMEDNNSHRESSGSESYFDSQLANREEEAKNCSENNKNFSEEQSMKTGSVLCSSWDDSDIAENKSQTQNQQLSLQDKECSESESEMHADNHQQSEDVSELDAEASNDLETLSTPEDTTSSEEDRMESEDTEEDSLDDKKLNNLSAIQSTLQDWGLESMNFQSEEEMKEFTEEDEDHEREEEGLAEYPSELSQSDSGDSGEGHEGEQPSHVDIQLVACSHENLEDNSLRFDDDVSFQMKQDSFRDDTSNSEITDTGESSHFGNSVSFQSYSSESGRKDSDSDISSDGDSCNDQEEKPDITSHLEKNTALQKQEHTFTTDFSSHPNSIDREVVDVELSDYPENLEICGVEDLSSILASSGARKDEPSGTNLPGNRNGKESHPSDASSIKQEHNSECSEVLDFGKNINTLLPGTFWSVTVEDNLKLDEYDWDIKGEEGICDEEDLEENDEEENERDWEKEDARIEAFNRYYQLSGEEQMDRNHQVTFCLEPQYMQYEKDSEGSEEDPSEFKSFKYEQSYEDDEDSPDFPHNSADFSTFSEELYEVNFENFCKDDDDDDFLKKLEIEIEQEIENARIESLNKYIQESKEERHEVSDRTNKALLLLHQEFSQIEEDNDSSEQESNTEDDTAKGPKTQDQSDSDDSCERLLYTGRHKVLKGLPKANKQNKETPKRNKCVVLLRSMFAVSLATAVGLLSYCWATNSLDWIY